MSKTKAAFGVLGFLLVVTVLIVTLRGSGAPDASVFEADFRSIEEELVGSVRDPGAWGALRARTKEFYHWTLDRYDQMHADGVERDDGDIRLALLETETPDEASRAADALANAYARSSLHEELHTILDAPGLRAASLMDQEGEPFGILDDAIAYGANMAGYEAARMVIASREGDHATAIRCARNADRLARLPLAAPCMVALIIRNRAIDALWVRSGQLLQQNAMQPALARTLLDIAARDIQEDRGLTRLMLRGEAISNQRILTMLYNKEFDPEDFGMSIPRRG